MSKEGTKGLTLIGVLLGILIGTLLLVALALFTTRGFGISRETTEQVRIVEDARVQIERMSDAIRDTRSIDTNGDMLATLPTEMWLQKGEDFQITFRTNFDADGDIEQLHYFVEGADLKLGVKDPYNAAGSEDVRVVARSVRNTAQGVPLFRYLPAEGGTALATPMLAADAVKRVEMTLVVDVDEKQDPPAATVSTIVAPRASGIVPAP